jgi:hypothetical protein
MLFEGNRAHAPKEGDAARGSAEFAEVYMDRRGLNDTIRSALKEAASAA